MDSDGNIDDGGPACCVRRSSGVYSTHAKVFTLQRTVMRQAGAPVAVRETLQVSPDARQGAAARASCSNV